MEISHDGTNLTINDVCRDCEDGGSDVMMVQCNASNSHGYVLGQGYLDVQGARIEEDRGTTEL